MLGDGKNRPIALTFPRLTGKLSIRPPHATGPRERPGVHSYARR